MTLLEMSLSGGCVILAGALLRALAKDRLPRWTFEALWTLAVLRLTTPVRLPLRSSVWTLLRRTAPAAVPAEQTGAATSSVNIILNTAAAPAASGPSPWRVLWIVVACLLALIIAAGYIRGYRRFRDAEEVDINFSDYLPSVRLPRRKVAVRVTDRVGAPLTYGLVRPVILLPRTLDRSPAGPLGFVLAHELAHIRRLDALRKPLLWAVVCLHWFNPAVWLMLVLASRDMELACDGAVIRACGPDARRDYAHALLDMEQRRAGLTGLASGFSRNAVEERIHSLMKMKKRSFWSALLALTLMLAVGAVFATAAPEPTDADVAAPGTFTGEILASSDGTIYVYTAGGEPIAMTREEYEALIDPVEVQWWTAEEYAAWLEQEKKDLQDCLGQRAWTNTDGWFTWTQEKIDETIEMYEQTLEDIQNGLLVSKTVDGSDDVMLAQGSDGDKAATEQEQALAERSAQLDQALAPYTPFGISYDYSPETDEMLLYWNGQPVRGLWDREKGIWISEHGGPGGSAADAPELIAVYDEAGELTGLRQATAEEQEQWDGLRQNAASANAISGHLSALMGGDGTTLPGCTDFRGRLGPYEKIYFDVGWVDENEAVTAAVSADKKMGCHVSICPAGEGPGDYLTAVEPDQAASSGAAEPASGDMLSSSGLQPGQYAVCVWSSVNEPIEFALSYMVS